MTPNVVVVGSINADLLTRVAAHPARGETVIGDSIDVLPGGKGANQAVAAARLGASVAMVGAVGDDTFAAPATASLREAGVALDALTEVPGATGVAVVTVSADGENAIVVIPGANATVTGSVVRAHQQLLASAAVVVLQGEIPREGVEAAARAGGGRVVLKLAPVIAVDPEVLRLADPLVVNEHEALGALELLGVDGFTGSHEDAARALCAAGVRSAVVTLGAAGALVACDGSVTAVPSPRVQAVDTTGAGDAFCGALAGRLAAGDDLVGSARFAARVGAFAVQRAGAQPSYPWADDELPEVS